MALRVTRSSDAMSSAVNAPRLRRVTMRPRLESRSCFFSIGQRPVRPCLAIEQTKRITTGEAAANYAYPLTGQTAPDDPRRNRGRSCRFLATTNDSNANTGGVQLAEKRKFGLAYLV